MMLESVLQSLVLLIVQTTAQVFVGVSIAVVVFNLVRFQIETGVHHRWYLTFKRFNAIRLAMEVSTIFTVVSFLASLTTQRLATVDKILIIFGVASIGTAMGLAGLMEKRPTWSKFRSPQLYFFLILFMEVVILGLNSAIVWLSRPIAPVIDVLTAYSL